ncbi:Rap1a/Tai family immunity protein [Morganella morganii]
MKKYLLILTAVAPCYSMAGFYNGNDLDYWASSLSKSNKGLPLTESNESDASAFQGYVAGVYDTGEGVLFCPPERSALKQMTDIVTDYLIKHPEKRNTQGADLVSIALSEKFPCKK